MFLVAIPCASLAENIVVRTGEHDGFTRVVFRLPDNADWEVKNVENDGALSVEVITNTVDASFDFSQAFNRIGRNRISDMRQQRPGVVVFDLSCDCSVKPFVTNSDYLVLDFTENSEPGEPSSEASLISDDSEGSDVVELVEPGDQVAQVDGTQRLSFVRLGEQPGIGPLQRKDPLLPTLNQFPIEAGNASGSELKYNNALDAARLGNQNSVSLANQLARDLASAATQGVLNPSRNLTQTEGTFTDLEDRPDEVSKEDGERDEKPLSLEASLSKAIYDASGDGSISMGGENCVPDTELNIENWIDPSLDMSMNVSELRGNLFGEFDRVDADALNSYVKGLIYYGFGAEARYAMMAGSDFQDNISLSLSYLLDGYEDPLSSFDGQLDCVGDAVFWSLLSSEDLEPDASINREALLKAIEILPLHLREFLAPKVVEKLIDAGMVSLSKEVLDRLERALGEETPEIDLMQMRADLNQGNLVEASQRIDIFDQIEDSKNPQQVLNMVKLSERQNTRVPQRVIELLEAFLVEYRHDAVSDELRAALMQSYLLNEEYSKALAVVDRDGGSSGDDENMRYRIYQEMVSGADDLIFLKEVVSGYAKHVESFSDVNLRRAASQRLLDLGMFDLALQFIEERSSEDQDDKLMRAKAYLGLSMPEQAEIELIGLRGQAAEELRVEARKMMGDHSFAQGALADLGALDDAGRQAWLSGDWEQVVPDESGVLFGAAQMLLAPQTTFDPNDISLRALETLSNESLNSRDTLRDLLEVTEVPELLHSLEAHS
jgi:hypothetical protein